MTRASLTDDQLAKALLGAAEDFAVPDWEGVPEVAPRLAWWQRRPVQVSGLVAASVAGVVLLGSIASAPPRQSDSTAAVADRDGSAVAGATTGGGADAGPPLGSARPPLAEYSGGTDQAGGAELSGSQLSGAQPVSPTVGGTTTGTTADTTRIVQTGSIALVVDDDKVKATVDRLSAVARAVGGTVSSSALQSAGDNPSASVTLRVPVARFTTVVGQITGKGFGAKVISADTSGKDVTAEYADTQAQITSLKAARDRYLTILNAAKSVGEILSVQQRVDSVQGQIDRLEGARRLLANQSDLATLEVSVNQKTTQVLVKAERSGWSKAWHDAGHGFTSGIQSIVARSGRVLLLILVLAAGVVVARGGWRVARRRLI